MNSDRRFILKLLVASVSTLLVTPPLVPRASALGTSGASDSLATGTAATLEAFADTLIPGQRRFPGDYAIAGAVQGPGAVQAGVIDVLTSPLLPARPALNLIASLLNARAIAYAALHLLPLPVTLPAMVGLSFRHRTNLVVGLFEEEDLDRKIWQVMSLLVSVAFDTAGHLDTATAVAGSHAGLTWLGFPQPDPDGKWRFSDFSYGIALADLHPNTDSSGGPA